MIPLTFDYRSPRSAAEAAAALRDGARIIGGGTWVVPELGRGASAPSVLVDLRLAGLDAITHDDDTIRIGATCTYSDLIDSDVVAVHLPLLHVMAGGITGGRQILNQGTLGGSLCAARPGSDAPGVVVALGGQVVVRGADGERRVASSGFFAGAEQTVLEPGELVVAIEFAPAGGLQAGYSKLKLGASSWPIATASALVATDAAGGCTTARVTLGGVAATPIAVDVTADVAGRPLDEEAIATAARRVGDQVTAPWGDVLAPADYRRAVAPVVAARALRMAAGNHDERRP